MSTKHSSPYLAKNYICTFNPVSNLFFASIMSVSPYFQNLEKAQYSLASHQKSLLNEGLLMRDLGLLSIEYQSHFLLCLGNDINNCEKICLQIELTYSTNHRVELKIKIHFISGQKKLSKTIPSHKSSIGTTFNQIRGKNITSPVFYSESVLLISQGQ